MSTKITQQRIQEAEKRIAALRAKLKDFELVCSGTLMRRMLTCGNQACACRKAAANRHGPYYYWGRRKGGRLVQMLLTPTEAAVIRRAISNYRAVRVVLRRWEEETVKIVEARRTLQA